MLTTKEFFYIIYTDIPNTGIITTEGIFVDIKKVAAQLCSADGVSGDESSASAAALSLLSRYTDDCGIDKFYNVFGKIGNFSDNKPVLLLDAHIDRVGLIVSYIDDEGFIKASPCGIDERILSAQTVTVHGAKKIKGVISTFPPHVKKEGMKDIIIDTGYSKAQLDGAVSLGDRITVDAPVSQLTDDIITASALDDRAGVISILYALELLSGRKLKYDIAVTFSSQEETGEAGAKIAAYNSGADLALEMDVSFAYTPDAKRFQCGEMGKGVMKGVAPSLDRKMSDTLINIAKEKQIPYQLEVMNGRTGTNADSISVTKGGIPSCTLSIPLKYMHTPTEAVDIRDIEATARLIAEFAAE